MVKWTFASLLAGIMLSIILVPLYLYFLRGLLKSHRIRADEHPGERPVSLIGCCNELKAPARCARVKLPDARVNSIKRPAS